MSNLENARNEINKIDAEMALLFTKRMEAARTIAEYKLKHGLEIFDSSREQEVIDRNALLIKDDQLREYYVNFLKNNMKVSKSYQDRLINGMKVAYCGTEGAFAHIATTKLFPTAKKLAYRDFEAAYKAVEDGVCDAAVLPVENSYNGEVGQVTDLMFSGSLHVNGIFELAVSQDLLGLPESTLDDIKEVVSHPQALGQCADFIREKNFEQREYTNTALAAKYVSKCGDKSVAAIASAEAAEIFGLKILARNINASRSNTTRFAIFTRAVHKNKLTEMGVHTILLFTVRNEAGALAKAIDIIGKHGFNMRCLRSRPMKELLWQYYFYVEAEGNIFTSEGDIMLKELELYCDKFKPIGTYIKG